MKVVFNMDAPVFPFVEIILGDGTPVSFSVHEARQVICILADFLSRAADTKVESLQGNGEKNNSK